MKRLARLIQWLPEVAPSNHAAAESYLSLVFDAKQVRIIMKRLDETVLTQFRAKDVFRASGLSLLGVSNGHVEKVRAKVKDGIPLSPILLVRRADHGKVVIADGYHRMCAVYSMDEDAWIKAKIVPSS